LATLTYYLKKRKNKGEHPLYLRITHNRKSRLIHTDIHLDESDWNEDKEEVRRSHPIAKKINNYLIRQKLNANQIMLDLKEGHVDFTVDDLKEAIEQNGIEQNKEDKEEKKDNPDFFEYAKDAIKDYKITKSYNRWKSFNTVFNKVKEFWGKKRLPFEDLTPEFLRKYEVYCMQKRGNKPNTVKSNLKKVRTIFNDAIREGCISRDLYPFNEYQMPSNPVIKPKLSANEIKAFKSVKTHKGTRLFDSQNIFMFAYYCWGMRFSDACDLQWNNIKGERLIYVIKKTGVRMSIKLPKQAKKILNYYRPDGKLNREHYIFPFLDHRKDYSEEEYFNDQLSSKNALVNKYLSKLQKAAGIEEHISFHIARHSFAQRCLEKDLRLIEIRDLLGHKKITTTIQYLKSLGNEHLDKTAEAIFS